MPIQHKPLLPGSSTMSLGLQTPWLSLQLPLWPCVRLMLSTRHRSELIGDHESWRYFAKLFDKNYIELYIADLDDRTFWCEDFKTVPEDLTDTLLAKHRTLEMAGRLQESAKSLIELFESSFRKMQTGKVVRSEAGTPWRKLDNASNFAACDGDGREARWPPWMQKITLSAQRSWKERKTTLRRVEIQDLQNYTKAFLCFCHFPDDSPNDSILFQRFICLLLLLYA